VLRSVGPPGSLFELLLPAGMRVVLSGSWPRSTASWMTVGVSALFRPFFAPTEGRPSIPIATLGRFAVDAPRRTQTQGPPRSAGTPAGTSTVGLSASSCRTGTPPDELSAQRGMVRSRRS
jgi:hypothetical protein